MHAKSMGTQATALLPRGCDGLTTFGKNACVERSACQGACVSRGVWLVTSYEIFVMKLEAYGIVRLRA